MRLKKILFNFALIVLPLIIIEISASIIIYQKEERVGLFFSLFNSNKTNQVNYNINWDKINNKIREEIAANLYGKDYKYYVRICEDPYFLSALENLDQARALLLSNNPYKE